MKWLSEWCTRRRTRPASPRRFFPQVMQLEGRALPAVAYYGGNLLPHVEAQALYYGAAWSGNYVAGQFEGFLQYLVNSPYMDMLTNAGYGVGRGTFSPGALYAADLPGGSNLLDSTIQGALQAEISNHSLNNPDTNRLYVVFVQADVVVVDDQTGDSSSRFEPNGFVGYHSAFAGTDANGHAAAIRYAVVVTPGGAYNSISSTLPTFDQMTSIASHEVAESVTDPDVNTSQLGWYDNRLGEIGDVYANDDVFLNHYVVQILAGQSDNPIVPLTTTYAAAEFPGSGVWRYDSSRGWVQLTVVDASQVDADANGDVVGEFPGSGVWRYEDATGWQQLTKSDASLLSMSGRGYVVGEFPGAGVWRFEDGTGWQQLSATDATQVGIDLYGNVVGEFPGYGVWRFDDYDQWQQISQDDASQVSIGDNGEVAGVFRHSGVWRYDDTSGWVHLTSEKVTQVGVDAVGNVFGEYPGSGVWRYEDTEGWVQLTAADASGVAGGAIGDVVATFPGAGLWLYDDGRGWLQLTPSTPSQFAIGA